MAKANPGISLFFQNGNPAPFRGLHPRIPIIIPTRGIGLINQGSGLGQSGAVKMQSYLETPITK